MTEISEITTAAALVDDQEKRSNGRFNRAAIKRFALKISDETRAGKFQRISTEFLELVEASTEAALLTMRRPCLAFNGSAVDSGGEKFLTGEGERRLIAAFNEWIAGEIHRQTKDIRTGKTF